MDENVRRFQADVPMIAQWDDHETTNNWYPGEILEDKRYTVREVDVLAARGRRAMLEYSPIPIATVNRDRVYRAVPYGPLVEVIVLDQRSYRGPNSGNRQETAGPETAFHGSAQLAWLKGRLKRSRSTWKVIASDMPIGLIVGDGPGRFENAANGDGPPLGRELEFADLFGWMKRDGIRNVVWLTADVHYAAAHYYDPVKAKFTDFDPFWEFVAGPLHAGTFGPGQMDNTFGPQVKFVGIPKGLPPNRPPSDGYQFFGKVKVEAKTRGLRVSLHRRDGESIYSVELPPTDA
jgi:alkaline phosphatase D